MAPKFSVIISTYDRGHALIPAVKSVLKQEEQSAEIIVVHDGPDCSGSSEVEALCPERVSFHETEKRFGYQGGPNSFGLSLARGEIICYLGHDDVWYPDHLTTVAQSFAGKDTDFTLSGCLDSWPSSVMLPSGQPQGDYPLTYLLCDYLTIDLPFEDIIVASALSHKRDLNVEWVHPEKLIYPSDLHLFLSLAQAGYHFRQTGHVTCHKFSASNRYLEYLAPSSKDQELVLDRFDGPNWKSFRETLVQNAHKNGWRNPRSSHAKSQQAGAWLKSINALRGSTDGRELPPGTVTVSPPKHILGLDWQPVNTVGINWSLCNPNPRINIPYRGSGQVFVWCIFLTRVGWAERTIEAVFNGQSADASILHEQSVDFLPARIVRFTGVLREHRDSYVELDLGGYKLNPKRMAFGVAGVVVSADGSDDIPERIRSRLRELERNAFCATSYLEANGDVPIHKAKEHFLHFGEKEVRSTWKWGS